MRFSIITPNYNGSEFLEKTIRSVLKLKESSHDIEYILIDGESDDSSHAIIERYRKEIDVVVIEKDSGPANAINKGLALASGDAVSWLNADDLYCQPGLDRISECFAADSTTSFCFGKCIIIDESGEEIRKPITRFKEFFFPLSSRFLFQSINYISQPAMFFRKSHLDRIGNLREDLVAAWDYEFMLRLWRCGRGIFIPGCPFAAFRWQTTSISGRFFQTQFKEELEAAKIDAGRWSPQVLLHHCVRWGIVGAYSVMSSKRKRSPEKGRELCD